MADGGWQMAMADGGWRMADGDAGRAWPSAKPRSGEAAISEAANSAAQR
jgi:hypothetical protein